MLKNREMGVVQRTGWSDAGMSNVPFLVQSLHALNGERIEWKSYRKRCCFDNY